MAAWRDASWYEHPGKAWVYHVVLGDFQPACNQSNSMRTGVSLCDFTVRPAAEVPLRLRCRRPGCRVRWPAEVLPTATSPLSVSPSSKNP
jgi:hypothetical protein